jgi:PAS domain S-box-containing protein
MTPVADHRLVERMQLASMAGGVFSVAVGAAGLAGWTFHSAILKSWLPGQVTMRFNAAVGLVALGLAVLGLSGAREREHGCIIRIFARICASVSLVVGLLTLLENLLGWNLGIDQLLYMVNPAEEIGGTRPGLLPTVTSASLAFLGCSLLILNWRTRRGGWPAQWLASFAAAISSFAALDFVLKQKVSHTHVALPAAICFMALSLAVIGSRADWAVGGLLASSGMAGKLLRRSVPIGLLALLVLGRILSTALLTEVHFNWLQVVSLGVLCCTILVAFIVWMTLTFERSQSEQGQRLAAIVECSEDAIFSKDLNGIITTWNKSAERLYGYSEEEAVGKHINLIVPRELHEEARLLLREVAQGKVAKRHETVRVKKDGSRIYISLVLSPVRDGAGNIIGASVIGHDITEAKNAKAALEESEEKLRLFIEHAPAALAMFDHDMRYLEASSRWKTERGLEGRDVRGLLHYEAFPWAKRWQESHRRALSGEVVRDENAMLQGADGTERWIRWEIRPWHAKGEIGGIIILTEDITVRKQAEEAAERYTRELKRSNEELEQFAYIASHDLQEPLRMVASYSELLAERYHGKLDANADKYIGYAVDGAHRMQRLIRDLLAYSRVSSQARPLQATDASAVLNLVIATMKAPIQSSGAEVICRSLPNVMADEGQLAQVFQNLIGNALKFHSDAPPRIEIGACGSGDVWQFIVADNGIGIAKENAGRIFQMFQRLHTREEYEGSGIGLAIARRIVERHGGRIWFDSTPGQGTTFYFTLPRVEKESPERAFSRASGRG